jgi:hypothetical protein
MTAAERVLLGAALGALVTLAVHPATRAMYGLWPKSAPVAARPAALPLPETAQARAEWVRRALAKHGTGTLDPEERRTLRTVIRQALRSEPDNAFWSQAQAVLEPENAARAWRRASLGLSWNDHQSRPLLVSAQISDAQAGSPMAWHRAEAFYRRDLASVRKIERTGREMVFSAPDSAAVERREQTLRNGSLIARGARQVDAAYMAADLIDLCAYPTRLGDMSQVKRLYLGRLALIERIRESQGEQRAQQAQQIFWEGDGLRYLVSPERLEEDRRRLTLAAVLCASLPRAFLWIGLAGAAAMLALKLVDRLVFRGRGYRSAGVVVVAAILGTVAAVSSRYSLVGLAVAACTLFLVVGPRTARRARERELGPLFEFVVFLATLGIVCAAVLAMVVGSAPGQALLSKSGLAGEVLASGLPFSAAGWLFLAALLIAVPLYSLVLRQPTPHVLRVALGKSARAAAGLGILLAVIGGPVCFLVDQDLQAQWNARILNEPAVYNSAWGRQNTP